MPKPVSLSGRVGPDRKPSAALAANIARALSLWADSEVSVSVQSKARSLSANSYYWVAVVPAVRELLIDQGYSVEVQDVHDMLKKWFLPVRIVQEPSRDDLSVIEERVTYGSTRTDSHTFAEYINAIRDHAPFVEAGLFIPEPGEKLRGRTIEEPGGTKITFRDPREPEFVDPLAGLSDAGKVQAQLAGLF